MRRRSILPVLAFAACARKSNLPELGTIPPFEFTDQTGQRFSSEALAGRIWVADFFFTNCPGPCPRMSNQLKRVQTETQPLPEVRLVSITVDPDRDTPEALAQYARRFQADPQRWFFLTGRKDRISSLMSESFYLGSMGDLQAHSTRFVLVDQEMKIRGFYDSFAAESINQLIEDIRSLHDRP